MQVVIINEYLRKLYEGIKVPGKPRYNAEVIDKFKKTIIKMQLAENLQGIRAQNGLNFEALSGELKGYYSVRVNYNYRLILKLDHNENIQLTDAVLVYDLTNHYQ